MSIPDYPPNSEASKRAAREVEDRETREPPAKVVSGEAVRRKKPLRKQFAETFVAGDLNTSMRYVVFDILIPSAKDTFVEAVDGWVRNLIFGNTRRRGGSTPPQSGPTGYITYNRQAHAMSSQATSYQTGAQRAFSRRARSVHDFDELVLETRIEGEEVIDRLYDMVSKYDSASVADLYALVGLASTHTDYKWGWTDIRGAGVSKIRGGYLLDLPEPKPLD